MASLVAPATPFTPRATVKWVAAADSERLYAPSGMPGSVGDQGDGATPVVVTVPLNRIDRIVSVRFTEPAAEAEYECFVYRRGHLRDAAVFAACTIGAISVNAVESRGTAETAISASILVVLCLATAGCVTLELVWRSSTSWKRQQTGSASSPAQRDQNDTDDTVNRSGAAPRGSTSSSTGGGCGDGGADEHSRGGGGDGFDHLHDDSDVDLDVLLSKLRRMLVWVSLAVVGALVWALTSLIAGECSYTLGPTDDTRSRTCIRCLHHGRVFTLAIMALFIYWPLEFIACALPGFATIVTLQIGALPEKYDGSADTVVQLMIAAVVALWLAGLVAVRDRRSREHFEAVVEAHVTWQRTMTARHDTAVALAAVLPAALARRASKCCVEVTDGVTGMSLKATLADLTYEAETAAVAVTEAVSMAAFQRRCPNPRATVTVLSHLFSLFDIGTEVFGVERAGTFGDAYVVSVVLASNAQRHDGGSTSAKNVLRFVLWQLGLEEIESLPLHSAVVSGRLRGAVVGSERLLRYSASGAALATAHEVLRGVPAQQVWTCGTTAASCGIDTTSRVVAVLTDDGIAELGEHSTPTLVHSVSTSFINLMVADVVADRAAPLIENVASCSLTIARDGRAGSHYSLASDQLVRARLRDQLAELQRQQPMGTDDDDEAHRNLPAAVVRGNTDEGAASAAGENNPLATPPNGDDDGAALMKPPPTTHDDLVDDDNVDSVAAAIHMGGFGSWRFASSDTEAAYQAEPRRYVRASMALLALFLTLAALVLAETAIDSTWGKSDQWSSSFALPLLGVVLCILGTSVVIETWIARRPQPLRVITTFLRPALIVVPVGLVSVAVFGMQSSVVRNDPSFMAMLESLILSWCVFDRLPWWAAGAAASLLTTAPAFATFTIGHDHDRATTGYVRIVAYVLVTFATVAHIVLRLRLHFAARFVARHRAAALHRATSRLFKLADALMPAHVQREAMGAADAAFLNGNNNATEASEGMSSDDDIERRVADLGAMLRQDYSPAHVDAFTEVVVVHVSLRRRAESVGGGPPPTSDSGDGTLLEALWGTVEECLDQANAAFGDDEHHTPPSQPSDPPPTALQSTKASAAAAAKIDRTHGNSTGARLRGHRTFGTAVRSLMTVPALADSVTQQPSESSPLGDATGSTLTSSGRPVHSVQSQSSSPVALASTSTAPSSQSQQQRQPLLLVSHLRDSFVLVAPLALGADQTVVAAGAVARFIDMLASRTRAEANARVACGIAAGEVAAAVVGRGTMRYGVYGLAMQHAAALCDTAEMMSDAVGGAASMVAATEHFAARYHASGETEALSGIAKVESCWAVRGMGRVRPHVWRDDRRDDGDRICRGNGADVMFDDEDGTRESRPSARLPAQDM